MKCVLNLLLVLCAAQAWATKEYDKEVVLQPITNEINSFTTDGCSRFSDGNKKHAPWLICCEIHDVAYWSGVGGMRALNKADAELYSCVSRKTNPILGALVYSGPRLAIPLNTNQLIPSEYRWGYGWPFVLGTHIPLNTWQKESIRANLHTVFPAVEARRAKIGFPALTKEEKLELAERIKRLFWEIDDLD